MIFLGSYDIEPNKVRQRLAQYLLDAGMDRVQRSVFIGPLTDAKRLSLLRQVESLLHDQPNVHFMLLPLLHQRTHDYQYVGVQPPDWDYLTDEKQTMIL